jgi:DNA mismatch repair protein MutL
MGRIRVLPDEVANKIAAGEVVERPASVVKELLENSLDAGATELRIEVSGGGRRLIRVADNGSGMLRDDALLAFERHATSKLASARDLLSIATLGFRGEALPSIASVCRLTLESRTAEETTGLRVEVAGSRIQRADEAALAVGTQVTVRDLFYNMPARQKFLRSEQTELAHIASLVTHYSLAHPDKTFRLLSEGRQLLDVTPVERLRDRVYQIFGSRVLEELVELGVRERSVAAAPEEDQPGAAHTYRLRGFISRPQVQKSNRNSVFLFVNRRLIRDRLLLRALSTAYHNLIPAGAFPFALLFLECDHAEVDVNVHPSKTEVRFRRQSLVHDFVRDAIREALLESKPISALPLPAKAQPAAEVPYSEFSQRLQAQAWAEALPETPPAALPELTLGPPRAPAPRLDFGGAAVPGGEPPRPAPPALRLPVPDTHGGFPGGAIPEPALSMVELANLRPLGQIHASFIVAAGRDGLWIIDQHVAHERVLFERILKERAAGRVERQPLLMPLIVQLTPAQEVEFSRIAEELAASGFEAEPFGGRTVAVKAAPAGVGPADIDKLLFEILEVAERELRGASLEDVRRAVAASIACRAAIKINTPLDERRIEWLLGALAATDAPMSCPHGRPTALRYSLRDILKGFHRV